MKKTLIAMALLTGVSATTFGAPEPLVWPRFRGPNGSGVAEGQNPPVQFGPETNVKWKVSVPSGLSSPIVAGDKLVLTAFEQGKLYTVAYQVADGREAWRREAPARQLEPYHKTEGSPAASTPATDGERIVSYFGSCGLFCYDLAGKELWRSAMPAAGLAADFGSGVSPIIADGVVVLVRDETKTPEIVALDARTGQIQWRRPRQSRSSYCTPVLWETPSGKQVAAAGHARMIGYNLQSGEEIWSVGGVPSGCCSSPVVAEGTLFFAGGSPGGGDDRSMQMPTYDSMLKDLDQDKDGALSREEAEQAFQGFFDNQDANKDGKVTRDEWDAIIKFMSEGKNSAFALKAGGHGDVTGSHVLWSKTKGLPYVPSALAYQGQYVMIKDGGIVTAYELGTGKEVYQERAAAGGTYYASPVAANGHIYFTSLDGAVTVLKAGAEQAEVLAHNPKLGERTAATPAIAGDCLYIRTDKHLYAFAAPGSGVKPR
ncbi:MAG: PQQ-binding-like beta-propeller repeat protein [Verrucomicrobiota bacterium]